MRKNKNYLLLKQKTKKKNKRKEENIFHAIVIDLSFQKMARIERN